MLRFASRTWEFADEDEFREAVAKAAESVHEVDIKGSYCSSDRRTNSERNEMRCVGRERLRSGVLQAMGKRKVGCKTVSEQVAATLSIKTHLTVFPHVSHCNRWRYERLTAFPPVLAIKIQGHV